MTHLDTVTVAFWIAISLALITTCYEIATRRLGADDAASREQARAVSWALGIFLLWLPLRIGVAQLGLQHFTAMVDLLWPTLLFVMYVVMLGRGINGVLVQFSASVIGFESLVFVAKPSWMSNTTVGVTLVVTTAAVFIAQLAWLHTKRNKGRL